MAKWRSGYLCCLLPGASLLLPHLNAKLHRTCFIALIIHAPSLERLPLFGQRKKYNIARVAQQWSPKSNGSPCCYCCLNRCCRQRLKVAFRRYSRLSGVKLNVHHIDTAGTWQPGTCNSNAGFSTAVMIPKRGKIGP